MRILVTDGMAPSALEQLRSQGHEIVEQFYEPEALGPVLRDFDAVVVRSATKVRRQHIDQAAGGRLRLIIRGGVGVDNIDVPYAEENGISVRNTPRASSNAVAELGIALLFSCARSISIAGHTMREQKWEKKAYSKGFELMGKTLGVIGYGRIGRLVGQKAQALGMTVLSTVHRHQPADAPGVDFVPLEELFARSDLLILCAPGGEKPIVDADSIASMKDGVVIVNVSRGANVDEAALLAALDSGKVKAAALDVWADEKNPNWALAAHPAVTGTPHIGAGTREAQERIGAEIVEIIGEFNR